MTKTNTYKYYLANGECVEYSLSPVRGLLIQTIEDLVTAYARRHRPVLTEIVVTPYIASELNKELIGRYQYLGHLNPPGNQLLKLMTVVGPVTVNVRADLEMPIFLGSEREYEDNSFDVAMEEILS